MAIHQDITINAPPENVYEILQSSEKFQSMTGGREAKISNEAGGEVSLFGGAIQARNIELIQNQRIVQAWRAGDWPDGVYSIIRFELNADGANTKISFDQSGHPKDAEPHLEAGWHQMYWGPMNEMVAKS